MEKMKPLEDFIGKNTFLSLIGEFGTKEFFDVPKQKRAGKLSQRATPGVLVCYSPEECCNV